MFIENYRAGAFKALGLGYEDLKELNPRLIYCSMTAFGQEGPRGGQTAYDHAIQATSGITACTGTPESAGEIHESRIQAVEEDDRGGEAQGRLTPSCRCCASGPSWTCITEVDEFMPPWTGPETIRLLHGNCESGLSWFGRVLQLAARHRVVRRDMRGFAECGNTAKRGVFSQFEMTTILA